MCEERASKVVVGWILVTLNNNGGLVQVLRVGVKKGVKNGLYAD